MSVHAFDGRRALAVRIALAVCALATSAICRPAAAQESKITMSILGFNADASTMLVKLDDVKTTWLDKADKSDPLNQSRRIGFKTVYGTILLNTQFGARIESSSAFSATFT